MKKRIFVSLGVMVFFLSFTVTTSFAENWIIDSKSNKLPKDLAQRVELVGGKLLKSWDFIGIAVAEFPTEADALAIETEGLKVMPDVFINWLPPEEEFEAQHIGEDEIPFYQYQWHLPLIEADKAWDDGITGAGVRVAVLDTGIWYDHADLNDNIDFDSCASFVVPDENLPGELVFIDKRGHGTHVAGIIAAEDNAFGSIGVAPNATIIAVKVMNQDGWGYWSWILDGIIHAVQEDADIINMSLRGIIEKGRYTAALWSTMNKLMNWAASEDVLVISAAGNDILNFNHSWNYVVLPAEAGNSIAISATGPTDLPAYYTNHGTSLIWVAAPGGDYIAGGFPFGGVLSTYFDPYGWDGLEWYAWMQGTSQATPCVAGVAALVLEKYGPMSTGRLKNILANSAEDLGKPGKDDYYGRGRVNAYEAVNNKK